MCGKSTVYVMFRSWDWLPSNKLNVGTRHGPLGETIPYGGKLQWTDGDETRHRVSQLPSPSSLVGTKFYCSLFLCEFTAASPDQWVHDSGVGNCE